MDEEKFSPIGGSGEPEKKGFKIKIITLLLIALIVIICVLVGKTVIKNKIKKTDENLVSATVIYELNRIKIGDEDALETYLKYSDLLNNTAENSEEMKEADIDNEVEQDESNTENDMDESDEIDDTEEVEDVIDDDELSEEDDKIFKLFLNTLSYEITNINVEKNRATVTVKISNKDSGEIFRNYFTRAIKLAINQALSTTKGDDGKMESELHEYLEEQVASSEISIVTNEVSFNLEKENNEWKITDHDKEMVDVVFPNLISTITELGEQYGEYGD